MKSIYLDIETIPAAAATLEAMMPESPQMPQEIASPEEPDWAAKCPKYGGDDEKRQAWITAAAKKWASTTQEAREKWEQGAMESRAKFIESAALRAESGHVKMIGLSIDGERSVYLWEQDRAKADAAEKEAVAQKCALFSAFPLEKQMFTRFAKDFVAMMGEDIEKARVITYYGNTFDMPFLARRSAISGEPALMRFLRLHRRGRYLDSTRFVDLHEEWTQGDRETRTGGLEGLAKILGVPLTKNGDGASFYHWYEANPGDGVAYLLNDLAVTVGCAERLGFT